ncbi:MAG: hypothetical protein JXR96_00315 [Deltaproteobacteria bacterium]|nr:hypothetical protein [Deltaproteobacteria bacterium]
MRGRSRLPEQLQINEQFSEHMTDVRTQLLFLSQAVGAMRLFLDGLIERLERRKVFSQDDRLLKRYRRALDRLERAGLRLDPPEDPQVKVESIQCPSCDAVLKPKPGKKIERCDWCGYVFEDGAS